MVPGTLQQAVVTEALASTLMAPALLYVTRAHATADLTVVAAISLFVVRGGEGNPTGDPLCPLLPAPFCAPASTTGAKPVVALPPTQCFCCS